MSNQAPAGSPPPWRKSPPVLVAWAIIGWCWLLAWLPYGAFERLDLHFAQAKQRRAQGENFGLLSDVHIAMARELDTPARVAELAGETDLPPEAVSTLVWTDEDRTYSNATREWDATYAVGYMAVTRWGRTTVGRYEMRLWTEACQSGPDSTDHFYNIECTKIAKVHPVPDLSSEPKDRGLARLVPGACVLGLVAKAGHLPDRYEIELPAGKTATVRLYSIPANLVLRARLFLDGKEIQPVPGRDDAFPIPSAADYDLQIEHSPGSDAQVTGQYSLQVHWGKAVGARCPIPEFDRRDCYKLGWPWVKFPSQERSP